jgi:non-ribosomal peptide synthetase component F
VLPQGVPITHKSLLNYINWHVKFCGIKPGDRVTQCAGAGFDAAVLEVWGGLGGGGGVWVVGDDVRINPRGMAR